MALVTIGRFVRGREEFWSVIVQEADAPEGVLYDRSPCVEDALTSAEALAFDHGVEARIERPAWAEGKTDEGAAVEVSEFAWEVPTLVVDALR